MKIVYNFNRKVTTKRSQTMKDMVSLPIAVEVEFAPKPSFLCYVGFQFPHYENFFRFFLS